MLVADYPGCDELRIEYKISRVERGIPRWLKELLRKQNGCRRLNGELESRALYKLFRPVDLDHCGITDWHGIRSCFVSEPYQVQAKEILELKEKGRRLGFAVAYDPLSYYYPGACHRIVLFPKTTRLTMSAHTEAVAALLYAGGTVCDDEPTQGHQG